MVTELQISTSPRSTWVWAPDAEAAAQVREITGAGPAWHGPGRAMPNVVDVDIGVTALETCEQLAAAGFTFTWHASEPVLNRDNWPSQLPGMPAPGM